MIQSLYVSIFPILGQLPIRQCIYKRGSDPPNFDHLTVLPRGNDPKRSKSTRGGGSREGACC